MSALEVHGLVVGFGGVPVVRGVDFHIEPGETLALVGESGCGKSMSAFAITRLLPPAARIMAGRVMFDGMDLARVAPRVLRDLRGKRISLIQQEPMTSLNPVLTVGRQVGEMIRRHEDVTRAAARARVLELFDLVGIAEPRRRVDAFPHQLSGGMRQRVMIAMAVACRPDLLIADEPTTALDVTIQAQVLELLDRLKREMGMAMLLITHDFGVVAQWADRVAVMYAGRIVEQAQARPFFARPLHPYSIGLLNASVGHDTIRHYTADRLTEIPGTVASAADQPGCPFAPRCHLVMASCLAGVPALAPLDGDRLVACIAADVLCDAAVG